MPSLVYQLGWGNCNCFMLHASTQLFTYILLFVFQERPPKPDVSWLNEHTWHICCDLEVRIGLTSIYCN